MSILQLFCCWDTTNTNTNNHDDNTEEEEKQFIANPNKVSYHSNAKSPLTPPTQSFSPSTPQLKQRRHFGLDEGDADSDRFGGGTTDMMTQGISTYVDQTEQVDDEDDCQQSLMDGDVLGAGVSQMNSSDDDSHTENDDDRVDTSEREDVMRKEDLVRLREEQERKQSEEKERLERERKELERKQKEEKDRLEKEKKLKKEQERIESERRLKEEQEKLRKQKELEVKQEQERKQKEKERIEKEKKDLEQKQQQEKERLERERKELERKQKEEENRLAKERVEKEKKIKEEQERKQKEQQELIRKQKEESEQQKKRENEVKEKQQKEVPKKNLQSNNSDNLVANRLQKYDKERLSVVQKPKITAERKKPHAGTSSEIAKIDELLQNNRVDLPSHTLVTKEAPQATQSTVNNNANAALANIFQQQKRTPLPQDDQKNKPGLMLDLSKALASRKENSVSPSSNSPRNSPRLRVARKFQVTSPDQDTQPKSVTAINQAQKSFSNEELELTEKSLQQWIEETLADFKFNEQESFYKNLGDGIALCRLVGAIWPDLIDMKRVKMQVKSPFFATANIQLFLDACTALGLRKESMFSSQDLTQEKNKNLIIGCLSQLYSKTGNSST